MMFLPPRFSAIPYVELSLVEHADKGKPHLWSRRQWKHIIRRCQWAGALELVLRWGTPEFDSNQLGKELQYLGFGKLSTYLSECCSTVLELGGSPLFPTLLANALPIDFWSGWPGPKTPLEWVLPSQTTPEWKSTLDISKRAFTLGWAVGLRTDAVVPNEIEAAALSIRQEFGQAVSALRLHVKTVSDAQIWQTFLAECRFEISPAAGMGSQKIEFDNELFLATEEMRGSTILLGRIPADEYQMMGKSRGRLGVRCPYDSCHPLSPRLSQQTRRLALWIKDRGSIEPSPRYLAGPPT
jgi:hypothetical protein